MRYIYVSKPGGKPLNIGMNHAKRRAARLDKQDRAAEVKTFDWTVSKHDRHHTQLVRSRHRYYHEQYPGSPQMGLPSDTEVKP